MDLLITMKDRKGMKEMVAKRLQRCTHAFTCSENEIKQRKLM